MKQLASRCLQENIQLRTPGHLVIEHSTPFATGVSTRQNHEESYRNATQLPTVIILEQKSPPSIRLNKHKKE